MTVTAASRADAGAYLARLLRFDPAALVRLRPVGPGRVELWSMVPFGVLVARRVGADIDRDVTVSAGELLRTLTDPPGPEPARRDAAWRWPLPPARVPVIDEVPAAEIIRVATAASATLRAAATQGVAGRGVGERAVRDALLDHVPIVVTGEGGIRVDVPQRLVQAVVRMGFIPGIDGHVTDGEILVTVRSFAGWIGLDGSYGSAWFRATSPLLLS